MDFTQVILILIVLSLSILVIYLFFRNINLEHRNKVNDITNLMLDIELKKKVIDEKYKDMSIDDVVSERNKRKGPTQS